MSSLVDLCIDTLVKSRMLPIMILDRIPYELYERYKQKALEIENKTIRQIVKWIIARELYNQVFSIDTPIEHKPILDCINKNYKYRYAHGMYMNTHYYIQRWYPKIIMSHTTEDPYEYDERCCYLNIYKKYTGDFAELMYIING